MNDSHRTTSIISPGRASERSSAVTAISSATTTDVTGTADQTAVYLVALVPGLVGVVLLIGALRAQGEHSVQMVGAPR